MRELVMLVGVETCGLKVKDLAFVIGRGPGSASRQYSQATTRRREEPRGTQPWRSRWSRPYGGTRERETMHTK